jgi:undecaprenyl-diphosphatase
VNGLYDFDVSVFRAINVDMHRSWLDPIFAFFSVYGLGGVIGASCLLFLLHKSTRHFALPMILTDAIAGWGVADGLKAVIVRDRPSNLSWAIVQSPEKHSSFPSGHTTTAFAMATMLVFLTWDTKYRALGLSSYIIAALIGLSRIYRGVHWPTDVLGGACCGIATACLLYLLFPRLVAPEGRSEHSRG